MPAGNMHLPAGEAAGVLSPPGTSPLFQATLRCAHRPARVPRITAGECPSARPIPEALTEVRLERLATGSTLLALRHTCLEAWPAATAPCAAEEWQQYHRQRLVQLSKQHPTHLNAAFTQYLQ